MFNDLELQKPPTRRAFLFTGAAAAVGAAVWFSRRPGPINAASNSAAPHLVTLVSFSDAGKRLEALTAPTLVKTDAEWRKQLSPDAFNVTRRGGTEYPYSGQYWNLHDKGLYRCICCDTALFNSETKFESGTGWPSFWQPIAKQNVLETTDTTLGIGRTAVSCRRCDAHLGHVFDDGPNPTGLRYCMNSVALHFVKFA